MADRYDHETIEKKWQGQWAKKNSFAASDDVSLEKYYCLVEFPYPSGEGLHVGHTRPYTALDILARKRRMQGYNVLFPMGFDAFGLPSENYAIKTGIHPAITTKKNIETFTRQLKTLGFSFDWERAIVTTDPGYYKWTQWIFLKLYEAGLAYKATIAVNWCPSCKIGLANEEVVDGQCERCGTTVEQKMKEQWMLRITRYADRLLEGLEQVDYPERVKVSQQNWIGRSYGVGLKNKVKDLDIAFTVYDSIPQTFAAQTFTVIAPDHPLLPELVKGTEHEQPVMEFAEKIRQKKAANKFDMATEMEGIFTGRYVKNFLELGRDLPIWVASYVVSDYGTGVVNCSAHDERDWKFAKKYGIPLHPVLFPKDKKLAEQVKKLEIFYREPDGVLSEPKMFAGLRWDDAREPVIKYLVGNQFAEHAVHYRLRDWIFSRQRYWGEPIPMIQCKRCGWVPVPEKQLPVTLPAVERYEPSDSGESPLASITDWVNVSCPTCKGPATRETDTMPNWAGSNWYFLRYLDPHNTKALASPDLMAYWIPVDWYNGGMEHTTLHLLYSRFIYKFLYDIGIIPQQSGPEPYRKRTSHGLILAASGAKMSKSKGNVINPDDIVKQFGADTLRVYVMFMGPFEQAVSWDTHGVIGVRRFLDKVWNFYSGLLASGGEELAEAQHAELNAALHRTIKKVGDDIETQDYNTAISALMIFINQAVESGRLAYEQAEDFLRLLALFAPHLAEELWQRMGHKQSITRERWPRYNADIARPQTIPIVVQVNGRVRDTIQVTADSTEQRIEAMAKDQPNVSKHLEGKRIKNTIYITNRLINFVLE